MAKFRTKQCVACKGTGKEIDNQLAGEAMRALRVKAKMTQAEIADIMKISKPYLCDLEHGFRSWRDELIERYRKALT